MRNAFLASASAVAIMLGGCSMFQSHDQSSQNSTPSSAPAYSGSSQAPAPSASDSSQTPSAAATGDMGSTSSKSMSHHSMARQSISADRMKEAQQKLKDNGDYKGQVDGKFGPQTAMAVKQYQQKNGLKQTGHLDHETLAKLGVGAGTTGSGSSAPSTGSSASGSSMQSGGSAKTDTANPPADTGSANLPADKAPAH